jgi:hypothetical protein
LIATKSGSSADLTNVPDTKDASRYLSYPFTTDVGTRVVVDEVFYGDMIATAVNMQAELYSVSNTVSTRVTGAQTSEVLSDSSSTSYVVDRFAFPDTLLASGGAYELRLYVWHGTSTINGFDDFGISFKPCLAGAPTLGEITRTSTTASVAFTPPALNGGSNITNYEYSIDSGATWIPRSPESTASPLNITGITADSAPAVQLRAVTIAGSGVEATSITTSSNLVAAVGDFTVNRTMIPQELNPSHAAGMTYSLLSASALPAGLTLDVSRGLLSGTPTSSGSYDFTIALLNNGVEAATKRYQGKVHSTIVFNNTALRFGDGSESSVNSIGLFQQPWYNSSGSGSPSWQPLTYSDYPLNMAIGTGTSGGSWHGSTVRDLNSSSAQQFDFSGYTATNANATMGYGKIRVISSFTINTQAIDVDTTFSLGQSDNFVKIVNKVINRESSSTITNLRIWVGTQDDWVGGTDRPTKVRGNLSGTNGSFERITSSSQRAQALQITTGDEGVLFYSTTPNTNMAMTNYGSFSNVYNLNPTTAPIEVTNDGSYAAVLPAGDISAGSSATITWFYAAGAINTLNAVAQAVAGAASDAPTVSRSGSNVAVSWTAPDAGTGRVVTGYQYRYYSEVDGSNNPIWIESSVLPSSQLSASLTGLSSSTAYNFQVRTTTGASGGGGSQTGDWSSTATLAAVPAWNPSSRSLTGPVGTAFSSTIETNSATGLSLGSGATVTVTGLPTGVSFNVLRASTANQFPAVELDGTPTVPGTYTVTITITDSAGNIVTSDFTFTVTSGGSGSSSSPLPIVTPTPTPVITPPSSRPNIPRPRPAPSPTPVVTVPLGPVALLEQREPTPNVRFDTPTQIPRDLADVLARPLGYTVEQTTGAPILPELTPMESLAYENGSPVQIQLVRTDEDNGYVLIGDGWQVALEAADSAGAPLRIDDSGNIILNRDRFVQFSGSGFAPGSIVKVWLFSDPTEVSEVIADASGNFVGEAQLPEGIPVGQHTVQLNGLTEDGQLRSVSLGVVVEPVAVVPAPVPFDFSGLMNMLWILAAGVLLFFFILWRRRKKEEEEVLSPVTDISEDLILASDVFEVQPTQQFPNDSRRKIGAAAPPNRKRFGFNPKGA